MGAHLPREGADVDRSSRRADALVTSGGESILHSHRREVAMLFADLRGWTSFVIEVPDAALRAVRLGCALREEMAELLPLWRKQGYDLDFGAGLALGYATCGEVGFEGRSDYAAIGAVTNLASRLADEARGGQVLAAQRLYAEVEDAVEAEPAGEFALEGFRQPAAAFNVLSVRPPGAPRP